MCIRDSFNAVTNIDESRLNDVSRVVESYSGIVIPANKPIVGAVSYTHLQTVLSPIFPISVMDSFRSSQFERK